MSHHSGTWLPGFVQGHAACSAFQRSKKIRLQGQKQQIRPVIRVLPGFEVKKKKHRLSKSTENHTPSVRKYQAVRTRNPKISEIRKSNIIISSTQPKEEFQCAFFGDSLKVRWSWIFSQTAKRRVKQISRKIKFDFKTLKITVKNKEERNKQTNATDGLLNLCCPFNSLQHQYWCSPFVHKQKSLVIG